MINFLTGVETRAPRWCAARRYVYADAAHHEVTQVGDIVGYNVHKPPNRR